MRDSCTNPCRSRRKHKSTARARVQSPCVVAVAAVIPPAPLAAVVPLAPLAAALHGCPSTPRQGDPAPVMVSTSSHHFVQSVRRHPHRLDLPEHRFSGGYYLGGC